jgi:hypothetical protein
VTALEDIRTYFERAAITTRRVLLIAGARFTNAIGDTVNFAYHNRFLKEYFCGLDMTVWGSDGELWTALCGEGVSCNAFVTNEQALNRFDLVVFDWVTVDEPTDQLFRHSTAAIIEISRDGGRIRYRMPKCGWKTVHLPASMNNCHRVQQAYEHMGLSHLAISLSRSRVPVRPNTGTVYLNPYGSTAAKCLDANLLPATIEALFERFGPGAVVTPSMPQNVPDQEREAFVLRSDIVLTASSSGRLRLLEPMSKAQYIDAVRSSAVVIGSDTSTQHVSSWFGVPSIACYPHDAGYRYYFWGCPGPNNLCFNTPGGSELDLIIPFASLVALLAKRIATRDSTLELPLPLTCQKYLDICHRVAEGTLDTINARPEIEAALAHLLDQDVVSKWAPFLMPELRRFAAELRARSKTANGADRPSLQRLQDVYAIKAIQMLAEPCEVSDAEAYRGYEQCANTALASA